MEKVILSIKNLHTRLMFDEKVIHAVNDVSLDIYENETIALVGESGSGKSMTGKSIMRMLPSTNSTSSGEIKFNGENLLELNDMQMRFVRGHKISLIHQEPMDALNPSLKIGYQIKEALIIHGLAEGFEAKELAIEMLRKVEIPDAEKRYDSYPHELSGGMQQRILIATALITNPTILIADEPTTALDVTIQAGIMQLLRSLQEQYKMSVLLITHDFGVVTEIADRIAVMYGGMIMEIAPVEKLYQKPLHPYTLGLINCIPKLNQMSERLKSIEGNVLDLSVELKSCPFESRCNKVMERCKKEIPPMREYMKNHFVRCFQYDK